MKKLLLLSFLASMMAGCDAIEKVDRERRNPDSCIIDSCEYIISESAYGFYSFAHKGNCRFCSERRKTEIRGILREIKYKQIMKTIQQVLGFVQGWRHAIDGKDEGINKENSVYQALGVIERYILDDNQ